MKGFCHYYLTYEIPPILYIVTRYNKKTSFSLFFFLVPSLLGPLFFERGSLECWFMYLPIQTGKRESVLGIYTIQIHIYIYRLINLEQTSNLLGFPTKTSLLGSIL